MRPSLRGGAAGVRNLSIFNNTEFLMLTLISMTQAIVAILINASCGRAYRTPRRAAAVQVARQFFKERKVTDEVET